MTPDKIKKVIADKLDVQIEQVQPSHHLYDDLNADSIDYIEIIIEFEELLDIEIPDDDTSELKTVDNFIEYLENKAGDELIDQENKRTEAIHR